MVYIVYVECTHPGGSINCSVLEPVDGLKEARRRCLLYNARGYSFNAVVLDSQWKAGWTWVGKIPLFRQQEVTP